MPRFAFPACAAAVIVPLLATGCLDPSYTIDREELGRLARTAPAERGQRVRVTQDLSFTPSPPSASAAPPLRTDVELMVALSIAADVSHSHEGRRPRRTVAVTDTAAGGGDADGDEDGDEGEGGDDGPSAALAVVMVVASAGIGVALAATEGARYDGWVELQPHHPVHLEGPNGEEVWVPLAAIDTAHAAWAEEARISGTEGAVFRLGRAPLDRVGFTYALELGVAETGTIDREGALGFAARTGVGFFPVQQLGLLLGLGVGIADEVVEWRPYLELQAYPLRLGRVHVGAYAQGGYAAGSEDVPDAGAADVNGWYAGGGGLVQLDVTTRLAVTLRGGVAVLPEPGNTQVAPEALLGIAIY